MRLIGDVVYVNKIILKRDKKNSFVHIPDHRDEMLETWIRVSVNGFSDIDKRESDDSGKNS